MTRTTSSSTTSSSSRTQVPKAGEVRTYGVVTEAEAVYEGAAFESDTHRVAELGIMPAAKVRSAQGRRHPRGSRGVGLPGPRRGRRARHGRRAPQGALRRRDGPAAPVGLGRDGEPVHVDLDFFDGRKGGHMSVSGISGVATKTSFALFFLRMLTAREHAGIVGEGAANLRVLVFNVKGEDLLWLDTPQPRLRRRGAGGLGRARRGAVAVPAASGSGRRPGAAPATSCSPTPAAARRGSRSSPGPRGSSSTRTCSRSSSPTPTTQRNQTPVRPRTRPGPAEALRGRRRGSARRRGAARPLVPAARARRGGAGGAGRARDRRPRLARGRARRLPRARGRLRAGVRLERARDGRHRVRLHAPAARRLGPVRTPGPRRDRRAASTAPPPASRSWRSSRCTTRRSGSSSARC